MSDAPPSPPARRTRLLLAGWALAAAAGVAVSLPTFGVGFLLDDYHHLAVLEGAAPGASRLGLWDWADHGVSTVLSSDPQGGWLLWCHSPELRLRFLRPLSALLHRLDHHLYGRAVVGWRVTSLAVWLALLLAVGLLYRELAEIEAESGEATRWSAAVPPLALLLFAVDDCHAWNLAWLAARHSLLAALAAVVAIRHYLRWRRGGGRRSAVVAAVATAVSLGCGENGLNAIPWMLAHELALAGEGWAVRLRRVAPFLGLAVAYGALHRALGNGVAGMRWYADPLGAPLELLTSTLPVRGAMLLVGLFTPVPAEALPLGTGREVALGAALLALTAAALVVALGRLRVARFLAAAVLLSLPLASIPMCFNYMLLLPSVAGGWLVAAYLVVVAGRLRRWLRPEPGEGRDGRLATAALAAVAVVAAVSHLGLAPAALVAQTRVLADMHRAPVAAIEGADVPADLDPTATRVVVVVAADQVHTGYLPLLWREAVPGPHPAAVWVVSRAAGRHRLHRTGSSSFELTLPGAGQEPSLWDSIIRDPSLLAPGQVFRQGGMTVTVRDAEAGRIRRLEVALDRPLDSGDVVLLAWNGQRLARIEPPPVNDEVAVGPHPLVEYLRRRSPDR